MTEFNWFSNVLAVLTALLAPPNTHFPKENVLHWEPIRKWEAQGEYFVFTAKSEELVPYCKRNPGHYIIFSSMVYAVQSISIGALSMPIGPASFYDFRAVYEAPEIPCQNILSLFRALSSKASSDWPVKSEVVWKVTSQAQKFSRIHSFPEPVDFRPFTTLIHEALYLCSGTTLIAIAVFCWALFRRKVDSSILIPNLLTQLCFATYCLAQVPGLIGVPWHVAPVHRFGEMALFFGSGLFVLTLRSKKLIGPASSHIGFGVLSLVALGNMGVQTIDQNCALTTFGITFALAIFVFSAIRMVPKVLIKRFDRKVTLEFASICVLIGAWVNDTMIFMGANDGLMIGPLGFIANTVLVALSLDEGISLTYRERDYLRANLEQEVARKTEELLIKAHALEVSEKKRLQQKAQLGEMAAQVAHDIRSPLMALKVVAEDLQALTDEKKLILNGVMERIQLIAQTLLEKNREIHGKASKDQLLEKSEILPEEQYSYSSNLKVEKLHSLIEQAVSEKKLQFRANLGVQFEYHCKSPEAIAQVNTFELSRILSNLLNNAVEALKDSGVIHISLKTRRNRVEVHIQDNGIGISKAVLPKLTQKGQTVGETHGSGLGLYHASETIKQWGGSLVIKSKQGRWTRVSIDLPFAGDRKL